MKSLPRSGFRNAPFIRVVAVIVEPRDVNGALLPGPRMAVLSVLHSTRGGDPTHAFWFSLS